jgi:acyl-CoA thioesterase I
LGGNDGLRALDIPQLRSNLAQMVDLASAAGAKILLLGMRMPPNYGPEYTEQFQQSFNEIARSKKVALVPFLMNGIALSPALMQEDNIHPNADGQPLLLNNVWPSLKPLLRK